MQLIDKAGSDKLFAILDKFKYIMGEDGTMADFAKTDMFKKLISGMSDELVVAAANSGKFDEATSKAILSARGLGDSFGKSVNPIKLFKEGIKQAGKEALNFGKTVVDCQVKLTHFYV